MKTMLSCRPERDADFSEDVMSYIKCLAEAQRDVEGNGFAGSKALATWRSRFIAWLIDVLMIGIPIALIPWPLGFRLLPLPVWIPFVDFGLRNVAYFLYWAFMEGYTEQSFGKMVVGIKISSVGGDGIDLGQSVIQSLGKAFLLPIDCVLGWILYWRRRQRLFNSLANTVVMEAERKLDYIWFDGFHWSERRRR